MIGRMMCPAFLLGLTAVAGVRSLALKYLMGLFDDPYRFCDLAHEKDELFSERNQREVVRLYRLV